MARPSFQISPDESSLLARVKADGDSVMPPKGEKLTAEQIALLEKWIKEGARWPDLNADHTTLTPLCDDLTFLRRVTLDTVGVVPTPEEIRAFLADAAPTNAKKSSTNCWTIRGGPITGWVTGRMYLRKIRTSSTRR